MEVGQRASAGTSLAKVVQPEALKAVIRVPETQAKDIQIGQTAVIDTRNGLINGRVARVDPAVSESTVTLDITLLDVLPQGARPDMAVDAKVEIERLQDVLFVGRMVNSQAEVATEVFRLTPEETAPVEPPFKSDALRPVPWKSARDCRKATKSFYPKSPAGRKSTKSISNTNQISLLQTNNHSFR